MATGFDFYEGTTSENTTPRITVRKGGQRDFPAAERLARDLATLKVQQPDGSFVA